MSSTIDDKIDTECTPDAKATNIKTIVEGSTTMCYPADQESAVFYNPVQVQNRDLSILMITLYAERRAKRLAIARKKRELKDEKDKKEVLEAYAAQLDGPKALADLPPEEGITILDALAASGLRSIRYWNEVPAVRHVTINDLEQAAVDRAHTNITYNKLQDKLVTEEDNTSSNRRTHGIRINLGDALNELYMSRCSQKTLSSKDIRKSFEQPQWDVVDLDPYGSAAPFLDAAVQAVESGGLLCITCTDMAALGGSHPETCFGRYAAMPIPRAGYLHELALRILLQSVATSAARYGRTIRPILSVGMDFYIRVFCEVYDDKAGVNALSLNIGCVYQSTQSPTFLVVPMGQKGGTKGNCYQPGRAPKLDLEEPDGALKIGGPMWLGPLHDREVVGEAIKRLAENSDAKVYPIMKWIATRDRLRGMLTMCHEELLDAPLYYKVSELARTIHVPSPPLNEVKAALINAGYQVSGFHKEPQALKTNAPNRVVWDIFREWAKKRPPPKAAQPGSLAEKILSIEPTTKVDFTIPASLTRKHGVPRFPMNPEPNWGPKPKASGHKRKAEELQATSK